MENVDDAVTQAIGVVALLGSSAAGAAIGVVAALVIWLVLKIATRKSRLMARVLRRTRGPFLAVLAVLGAWIAFGIKDASDTFFWYHSVYHGLLLALIACTGWYLYRWAHIFEDMADLRTETDLRDGQRLKTQAQVFQRVLQTVIIISAVVAMLLTFPAARAPLASLLASASLVSVIVGLAAQSTLGNMFAGMQLAFTDAIRVGDTVTAMSSSKEQTGTIEEITLTYVVMRMWNNRRILLPSSVFTAKPFENWTRASLDQLGAVELTLDWDVPMARLRRQVETILLASTEWDHRVWNVQMTESVGTAVTLRVVVSAANPADRWDLECYVREQLLAWITEEIPWALPRVRSVPEEIHQVNQDVSAEKVARLAENLAEIAGPPVDDLPERRPSNPANVEIPDNPVHAARLRASRRRAQRAKRRSIYQRSVENDTEMPDPIDRTMVITDPTMVARNVDASESGSRMYSGSPHAEQLRSLYSGPGEEVIRRREATVQMQALDARGLAQASNADKNGQSQVTGKLPPQDDQGESSEETQ